MAKTPVPRNYQAFLERIHKDFVDEMYFEFGLEECPKYAEIRVTKKRSASMILKHQVPNILPGMLEWLNRKNPQEEIALIIPEPTSLYKGDFLDRTLTDRKNDCLHESAHYLHIIVNHNFYINKTGNVFNHNLPDTRWSELTAELGVIIYLEKKGNLEEYLERSEELEREIPKEAHKLFKSQEITLSEMAGKPLKEILEMAYKLSKEILLYNHT